MNIAIVTFNGFNELDSFKAFTILNRVKQPGWNVRITSPSKHVTSMNGLKITAQEKLGFANNADAVIFGSGTDTRNIIKNNKILKEFKPDTSKQLIAAQCSGTLILASLGLLEGLPACTDQTTKPWVIDTGIKVLNQPFIAHGNVATAGGCLSSLYLSTWLITKLAGKQEAKKALETIVPVGEKNHTITHAMEIVEPYLR